MSAIVADIGEDEDGAGAGARRRTQKEQAPSSSASLVAATIGPKRQRKEAVGGAGVH